MRTPILRGDYLVDPPALQLPASDGLWVDIRNRTEPQPIFDVAAIPGEYRPIFSDWSMTEGGTAALVYVTQYPDDGLAAGPTEVGVLVRPLGAGASTKQTKTVLATLDPAKSNPDEVLRHARLVKVYEAIDRLVVVDFFASNYWIIDQDGQLSKHKLARDVILESCNFGTKPPGGNDCLDDNDINDPGSGTLVSIQADRSRLLLTNENRASSGSVPLLSVDLQSGEVAGPNEWRVASGISSSSGGVSCSGLEFCMDSATAIDQRSDGDVEVMNRFNPVTLERELVPVPEGLIGLSPHAFGNALLWTGATTVLTDLAGEREIWRLGENVDVTAYIPDGSLDVADSVILASNSNGEFFFVDPETGKASEPLVTTPVQLTNLDELVGFNDRWVVAQSGLKIGRVPS